MLGQFKKNDRVLNALSTFFICRILIFMWRSALNGTWKEWIIIMTKYIFVTGGVVSSIGKGIVAASLGRLLKNRGLKVTIQKFDPYINIDPGTMSPYQHGEVFVTDDGAETDLDLGHYERFIDINLNKYSNVTTGKIYEEVLQMERRGDYLGATVQVIPHITNALKGKIVNAAKTTGADIIITEVGGTVGDIESLPFLEALRQIKTDVGFNNVVYIHTTLLPYLKAAGEMKTKPTQHSVKELRSLGIQPDMLVVRTERPISQDIRKKLAQFCDVANEAVIESLDVSNLYQIPLNLQEQNMDKIVCDYLKLDVPVAEMTEWKLLVNRVNNLEKVTKIALVGKYVELPDAYLSVVEALKHAGFANKTEIDLRWINSAQLTAENVAEKLAGVDGIIVPGGFGKRGTQGKIEAICYAREKDVPLLGVCLGMQLLAVEFARNIAGLSHANSTELDVETPDNVIDIMENQKNIKNKGGTLRLGLYPANLKTKTVASRAYDGLQMIEKRHRHRYEFNNKYREQFEKLGLIISGTSPDNRLVEIVELPEKKFFVGCQFHPELTSRPNRPDGLYQAFIEAAVNEAELKKNKTIERVEVF